MIKTSTVLACLMASTNTWSTENVTPIDVVTFDIQVVRLAPNSSPASIFPAQMTAVPGEITALMRQGPVVAARKGQYVAILSEAVSDATPAILASGQHSLRQGVLTQQMAAYIHRLLGDGNVGLAHEALSHYFDGKDSGSKILASVPVQAKIHEAGHGLAAHVTALIRSVKKLDSFACQDEDGCDVAYSFYDKSEMDEEIEAAFPHLLSLIQTRAFEFAADFLVEAMPFPFPYSVLVGHNTVPFGMTVYKQSDVDSLVAAAVHLLRSAPPKTHRRR